MSAVSRWARNPQLLVDVAVAVVVALLAVDDLASSSAGLAAGDRAADFVAYALVIAGSLSLVWRRRTPLVVLVIVCAVVITIWLRGYGAHLPSLGLPALYAVAVHSQHRRRAWWMLSVAVVVLMVVASVSVLDQPDGFDYLTALSMLAFLVGAIGVGLIVRNRVRIFTDSERRAEAAEADRAAEAQRAVLKERSRIAREMHDVVAHSMSVIAVQAAAGQEIVRADPERAAQVFARIEAVGRESLTELRRMLGVLRESGDDEASLAPQPGIADLATLVAHSCAAGVTTDLTLEGVARPLPPGVELTAYRIVQEALTNVRKHAGASARAMVCLVYAPGALVVEVVDDGCGAATSLSRTGLGQGLIGMRERVEIYGGELKAGPRPGGGFGVRASLPVAEQTPDTGTVLPPPAVEEAS